MQALRAMHLEFLMDQHDKYDLSNDFVCCLMLTKDYKPDIKFMKKSILFIQAQIIIKTFKATTQFSKHSDQPSAHIQMKLKSSFPAASFI